MLKGGAQRIIIPEKPVTKVQVILRVRPFLKDESCISCVTVDNENVEIVNPRNESESVKYRFDKCYSPHVGQFEIYKSISPLIGNFVKGINTTIFAYGNTGAGKTYTMVGNSENPGIIPNLVRDMFKSFSTVYKSKYGFKVSMSYMEIYNEKVYDLLNPSEVDLPIREDLKKNIFIPGLKLASILNAEDFDRQFMIGTKNRSTAATKLNENSSRSHAILQLCVDCINNFDNSMITTKFHLIDLAGSEDNRKTENVGIRLLESGSINKSLFVLGQVVDALNNNSSRIPYRDSKLTRMLQDSLGGKSVALMIANVAPCEEYFVETFNTLNFASKSKQIENRIVVSESKSAESRASKLKEWKEKTCKDENNKKRLSDGELMEKKPKIVRLSDSCQTEIKAGEDEIKKRLEALEMKMQSEGNQSNADIIGFLSPMTKEKNGKAFILRAKTFEEKGKIKDAVKDYQMAMKYVKEKDEIGTHIKKLKLLVDDENWEEDDKENAEKSKKSKKAKKEPKDLPAIDLNTLKEIESSILNILNKGNLKEIKSLKGIGDSRAQKIIAHLMSDGKFIDFNQLEDLGITRKVIDGIINAEYEKKGIDN